jgi:putative sterol carrier protein
MDSRLFRNEWARAWCDALNASDAYRKAAQRWEGSVALVVRADQGQDQSHDRAVFLDLHHGICRAAREATSQDVAGATYVIEAPPDAWLALLTGALAPMAALLAGQLRLVRGSIMALVPFASAAKELVETGASIHARFTG